MQRQKIFILLAIVTSFLFPFANPLHALQEASFSWTPNAETNLAGYRIHYGTSSAQYDQAVDMGNPAPVNGVVLGTVSGLSGGTTYYFAATAYDTDGLESDFSQEVVWTSPADPVEPAPLPITQDISLTIAEDITGTGLLAGQSPANLPLTYQIVQNGTIGTALITNTETGNFSYQPNPEINGVDTFTYRVSDANGISEVATVTVTINAVNDLPVADSGTLMVQEGNTGSGVLTGSDIDSASLTYRIVTNGLLGTAVITDPASGAYTYTPNQGTYGSDAFYFVINDGYGDSNVAPALITIEQAPLPTAQNLSLTVNEDTTGTGQLAGQSHDNLPLSYQIVQNGTNGTATITDTAKGNFSYQPNPEINGLDTFTYRVSDANGASEVATVTVTINPVNDLPVADNSALMTQEGNTGSGVLAGSDIDSANLTYRIVTNGLLGTAVITDPASGAYTYTPNQGTYGSDTFYFVVNDGYGDSNVATVLITIEQVPPAFTMETGEVAASGSWTPVFFSETFRDPVVVAKPAGFADPNPCTIRIRNVSSTGFEIRLQQYDYLTQEHGLETVGYLAMERGSFTLDNGTQIEAGTFEHQSGVYPTTVTFAGEFQVSPVVAAAIVTNREVDAVVSRVSNVSVAGFDYEIQEQEANTPEHGVEQVAYIAWEPSAGMIGEYAYEVSAGTAEIGSGWRQISFQEGFTTAPVLIADMQSINDSDTANLRVTELSATGVQIKVAEEGSYDTETDHDLESVGFMAISWIDLDGDSDGDALLTRDERDLYGTSPALLDTDSDGLDDGAEVSYWSAEWQTDIDGDGIINLLDADSDNDGYLDGDEMNQGSDPGDSGSTPASNPAIEGPLVEYGTVGVSTVWQRISFTKSFANPIVVAKITSQIDKSPCFVRVTNVDTTGFDLRLQEWDYLNDRHSIESVSYLVMDQGSYVLADGTKIEAGRFSTNTTSYAPVQFAQQFTVAPVVTTTVTSFNEPDGVIGRLSNISTLGVDFKLQEQESNPMVHATETVSYIAWEPSSGSLNGMNYDVNHLPELINDDFTTVTINTPFNSVPAFLANLQSSAEDDTATVRCNAVSAGSVELRVEEEKSNDKETSHAPEQIGYMAFGL